MGGQQFDGAVRQRPHLDAGTGQRDPGDPLLDDAAVLLEGGQIGFDGELFGLQLHAEQAFGDRRRLVRRAGGRQPMQVHQSVAGTGDTLVELHDRLSERRPPHAHALHAGHDLVERVEVLRPDRARHFELLEHSAAAGLAAEFREPRICAVHRDAEAQRDVSFERGGVVRDQMAAGRVGDQGPDLPQQSWTCQQLRTERLR